ncbi:MAG: YigZ family protein [Lachnospiraceae bacterium]|nr:YigZ family protein [Lachnospiraceae bacterium]
MFTVYRAVRGEYIEKKSRFIADLFYVESEEEAERALAGVRKEFYDARHHCSAFVIRRRNEEENSPKKSSGNLILRSSDDGEPQGTAGHPMLDVLTGAGLVNTLAVVTRYFGGTLLGTGGLVRSYTKALQDALEKSILIERKNGIPLTVTADYTAIGKLEYFFAKEELPALSKEYGENVKETLLIPEERLSKVQNEIIQMTGGKAVMDVGSTVEYAVLDGTVLTGEQLTG